MASRVASAAWPLMKPLSVPGVVDSAGTSAGTTTTLLLQRYGRAYLKKRLAGSVEAFLGRLS